MVAVFAMYVIIRKNMPSLFSFPVKHVLILALVVILILVGTLKGQILYVSMNQDNVVYTSYTIIVLSQLIFVAVIMKGTTPSIRQVTKAENTYAPHEFSFNFI